MLSVFIDIFLFANNSYYYYLLLIEAISILILIYIYFKDKKNSKNPFLIMKNGILMNMDLKQDINFQNITSIEIPPFSNDLVITFTYNNEPAKQPIFYSGDINLVKLLAEMIKEYADNNGFVNIEYKNCLFDK